MTHPRNLSRRYVLAAAAAAPALAVLPNLALAAAASESGRILHKPIPRGGEQIPVVGIGTSLVFQWENDPAKMAERTEVVRLLMTGGRGMIDTAAAYGTAEERVGDILTALKAHDKVFIATKAYAKETVEQREVSLKRSQQRLRVQKFDLMHAHMVNDPNFDTGQFREWKAKGICRYWGIANSIDADYPAMAAIMRRDKPDFLEVNYSLGDREAEAELLPLAQDIGAAVVTNLPFGRNALFKRIGTTPLPDWAKEIDCTTWAQVLLKFLISHPAVTAVIPGTDKPEYMRDNLAAGRGRQPDAAMRRRMIAFFDALPG
ncbi:MAG: aldo/keto reductase [Steroidobacteraceae bacterium]